jgi:molybdopterin-guanine dinucleotide biosynthesis protein A
LKNKRSNITACILSGGKSSRMGVNKSLLDINGTSLIERTLELLDSVFSEVVISSNEEELYEFLGKEIIEDIYPDRGPLSGIHSALYSTKTEMNFFITCDMPFINKELINYLINIKSDKDIVLPKAEGRIQHLSGIYSKKILPTVEKLIRESMREGSQLRGSIYELLDQVETEIVDVSGTNFYHSDLFLNINTHEDYIYAKSIFDKK